MPRAWCQVTWAAVFTALTMSAAAQAGDPPPAGSAALRPASTGSASPPPASTGSAAPLRAPPAPAASASAAPPKDGVDVGCDASVLTWVRGASQRTGLEISPVACPAGLVRLAVAGAGCDFEVRRDRGFQRTADGAFGVSPIADLDWGAAPGPMKKALAGVLSALAQDPSLQMGTGTSGPGAGARGLGGRRSQIIGGAAGALAVIAAAAALAWKRRKNRRATA